MGHVVTLCFFFIGNMGHRVTKLGHVCDPIVTSITSVTLVHGSQGHAGYVGHVVYFWRKIWFRDTGSQNWVTFVTRATIGHIDTKLGHVCDPGDFKNIGHNGTWVTGSRFKNHLFKIQDVLWLKALASSIFVIINISNPPYSDAWRWRFISIVMSKNSPSVKVVHWNWYWFLALFGCPVEKNHPKVGVRREKFNIGNCPQIFFRASYICWELTTKFS